MSRAIIITWIIGFIFWAIILYVILYIHWKYGSDEPIKQNQTNKQNLKSTSEQTKT